MSAAGRALSKALDRPDEWDASDRFRITHRASNQSFWMANGGLFFDGDDLRGSPPCLGLLERHWLYRKAKRIVNRHVAMKLAAPTQ